MAAAEIRAAEPGGPALGVEIGSRTYRSWGGRRAQHGGRGCGRQSLGRRRRHPHPQLLPTKGTGAIPALCPFKLPLAGSLEPAP